MKYWKTLLFCTLIGSFFLPESSAIDHLTGMTGLQAGFAREDITPAQPVRMSGSAKSQATVLARRDGGSIR